MKVNALVFFVILFFLLAGSSSMAQTFPNNGVSGIQVVNLDAFEAVVTARYYAEDGTTYTLQDVILNNQGDNYTYYAEPNQVMHFSGAVILSADRYIAAIINTRFFSNNSVGAYNGADDGVTRVLLPLALKSFSGQSTAISIQNTDVNNTVIADVTFYPQDPLKFSGTKSYVVQPGASKIIDLNLDSDFETDWVGSVSVSPGDDSTPLVAAGMTYTNQTVASYSGVNVSGIMWYLPLIRANFADLSTAVQVSNATNSAVSVDISYRGNIYNVFYGVIRVGYTCTVNAVLPANSSINFYNLATHPFDDVFGATSASITGGNCQTDGHSSFSNAGLRFLGSAVIDTDGGVAVVVNDADLANVTAGTYNGFLAVEAQDKIISPLARVDFAGYISGTQVQNTCPFTITAESTYITSPFSVNTNAPVIGPVNIAAGASFTFYTDDPIYQGWLGSLIVSTNDGDCLVGITNDATVNGDGDSSLFNTFAIP